MRRKNKLSPYQNRRKCCTTVAYQKSNTRAPGDSSRCEQTRERPSSVKHEFHERAGDSSNRVHLFNRSCLSLQVATGWMKEYDSIPLAQLVKNPTESPISRVDTVGVCQDLESHSTQVVESIIDLSERAFDIWKRQRSEELEILLVLFADL